MLLQCAHPVPHNILDLLGRFVQSIGLSLGSSKLTRSFDLLHTLSLAKGLVALQGKRPVVPSKAKPLLLDRILHTAHLI